MRKKGFLGLCPTNNNTAESGVGAVGRSMLNLFKNRLSERTHLNLSGLLFGGVLCVFFLLITSCNPVSTPKPYGYYRITTPDTSYVPFSSQSPAYPYDFALSSNAQVQVRNEEPYWINIWYPALDATIHCSYKPVQRNLRELTNDALEFVYRNASYATSIPESGYTHPEADVYGVLFDLEGNTASSCQFFVTDSTRHFFRASVYCNCPPNADSLAPVYNYLRTDIIRMVETFVWKK